MPARTIVCREPALATRHRSISIYGFVGVGLQRLSPDPDRAFDPDKVCATVHGRAIRLKNARERSAPDHDGDKGNDELERPDK